MRLLLYLTIFLSIFQSCKQKVQSTKPNSTGESDQYELKLIGERRFLLDSFTTPEVETLNYVFAKEGDFSFYNPFTKKIFFYNLSTGKLFDTINLKSLPVEKPVDIYGHYIHNMDSIFLIDAWKFRVYLITGKGKFLDSFNVNKVNNGNFILPAMSLGNATPSYCYEGKLFITGVTFGEFKNETKNNRPSLIVLDLNNRKTTYLGSYPDIYRKNNANWGGVGYRSIFTSFNKSASYLSFPASHYISKMDLKTGQMADFYAGSKYFDTIPAMDLDKEKWSDKDKQAKHHALNGSYSSVIYDPYRKMIYRVGELPLKEYKEGVRTKMVKQFSIIMIDSSLAKVGETLIPHLSHSRLSFFVSPMGLHMRKYENTEEELVISTFLPTKK